MRLGILARSTDRVANDPADGVASGDRGDALASLQSNVADLRRSGVELIKRALDKGIDLDGVDVAALGRFDLGCFIGGCNPLLGGTFILNALGRARRGL